MNAAEQLADYLHQIRDAGDKAVLIRALAAFDRAMAGMPAMVDAAEITKADLAYCFWSNVSRHPPAAREKTLTGMRLKARLGCEPDLFTFSDPSIAAATLAFVDTLIDGAHASKAAINEHSDRMADILIPTYRKLGICDEQIGTTIAEDMSYKELFLEDSLRYILYDARDNRRAAADYLAETICFHKMAASFGEPAFHERALGELAHAYGAPEATALAERRYGERQPWIDRAVEAAAIDRTQIEPLLVFHEGFGDLKMLIEKVITRLAKADMGDLAEYLKKKHLAATRRTGEEGEKTRLFIEAFGREIGLTDFAAQDMQAIEMLTRCAFMAIKSIMHHPHYSSIQMHHAPLAEGLINAAAGKAVREKLEGEALVMHWAELGHMFVSMKGVQVAKKDFGLAGIDAVARRLGIKDAYEAKLAELIEAAKPLPLYYRALGEKERRQAKHDFTDALNAALHREIDVQEQLARRDSPLLYRLDEEQCNMLRLRLRMANCADSFDPALSGEMEHLEAWPVSRQMRPSMQRIKADIAEKLGIKLPPAAELRR